VTNRPQICQECRMPVLPNEYHPYAACLMYLACHDSNVVHAHLHAVKDAAYQRGYADGAAYSRAGAKAESSK